MITSRLLKSFLLLALFRACLVPIAAQEWTGQGAATSPQCVPRTDAPTDYESWIADYKTAPPKENLNHPHEIQVSLTVLDGDDLKPAGNYPFSCAVTTTVGLASDGTVSRSRVTPGAFQGGGPGHLSPEDSKLLQPLLARLSTHPPDDYSRLPPPGHRVVLQVVSKSQVLARVYDRADLPEDIVEILGLTGATQGPLTMHFAPDNSAATADVAAQGIPETIGLRTPHATDPATKALRADTVTLAVSPDHSQIATRYLPFDGRVMVTDVKRSAKVFEEPDTTLKDRRWIFVSHAWFTPDGRFLLLLSNLPAMRIYDTKTWQRVDTLPGLPSAAVAYYPSPDWKHGIAVSSTGEVSLWDAVLGRKVASLDLDGDLQSVSFSPDDSVVAVTSVRQNPDQSSTFHLRTWATQTGQFLREMRSLYYFANDGIGVPQWWGDGKYLLAETREGRFGGYVVAIWNADSGKLRGGFSGCSDSINDPFAIALAGQQLLDWCPDGKLLTFNAAHAIADVAAFEDSVKPPPDGIGLALQH